MAPDDTLRVRWCAPVVTNAAVAMPNAAATWT
jgi:hypothetical protein